MIIDLPIDADPAELVKAARGLNLSLLEDPGPGRVVNSRDAGRVRRVEGVRLALGEDREHYRARRYGRRINAVSWIGHRDWMRAVFAVYPDAVLRTALDTWSGSADFEARHAATAPSDPDNE